MHVMRTDSHAHWIAGAIVLAGFFIGLGIFLAGCSIARSNDGYGKMDRVMLRGPTEEMGAGSRMERRLKRPVRGDADAMMPAPGRDDVRFEEPQLQ